MRRTLPATLIAALACLAAVPAPAATASAHHCPKGALVLAGGPHHRTACLPARALAQARAVPPLPSGARAAERQLEAQLLHHGLHGVRPPALRRRASAVRRLAASPALAAALGRPAATTSAARARAADAPIQAVPIGSAGAGEQGSGVDAWLDAGGHQGFGMGESGYAAQCPDRAGAVPVRGSERVRMSFAAPMAHRMTGALGIDVQATATGTGHVGEDARLHDFDMVANVSVVMTGTVYGPAGLVHGTPERKEFHLHIEYRGLPLSGPMPGPAETRRMTWVGGMDAADGSARAMLGVYQVIGRLRASLLGAQEHFYGLAACVRATYDPPSARLAPGEHRRIHATIASTVDGHPVSMDVRATAQDGASVTPVSQHADGSAAYDYRAPDRPATTQTMLDGTSREGRLGGRMVVVKVVRPDSLPYHYEVLGASLRTAADARQSGTTSVCNTAGYATGGTDDFTGSAGTLAFDASDQIAAATPGGPVSGQVFASVPASWSQHLTGCTDHLDGTYSACTTDRTDTPGGGTWPIGFQVEADSASAATARLHWSVPDAFVGYGSGGNAACNVSELRQYVPYADTEQDVPMPTLAGTAPFTLTFSGGPLHWDATNINRPVSLDYSWTFTLRLQRVDASGAPVG